MRLQNQFQFVIQLLVAKQDQLRFPNNAVEQT